MKTKQQPPNHLPTPAQVKSVGWVRPKAVTHQSELPQANLPTGWKIVRLGDIVDIQGGSQPPKSTFIFEPREGYVRLLQIRDFGYKPVPTYVPKDTVTKFCEKDDIFIARYGASLGRIVTGMEGAYNVALAKVIMDKKVIYPKYMFYLLKTPVFQTPIHMISRSAQNGFNKGEVFPILLPIAPLEQQKRIVAEIEKQFSRLDEAVANLKRVKANLKRYKAAVLKAAVEGRLVETEAEIARREGRAYETGAQLLQRILATRRSLWQGKGKYKEPAAPDTDGLPELPEGWVWAVADQISEFITKGTTPAATKLGAGMGEIQFLKVYNLTFDGTLNHRHKPAYISRSTHEGELARSKVVAGDVLINIVGPPLGQVSIVPPEIKEANINQAIARYRAVEASMTGYLVMTLLTGDVMGWAIRRAKTTAGQSNLTLELCRDLPVPLPPLAEQHRIVAEVDRRLSLIHELETQVDANLRRAERLRQAILSQAFSGGLLQKET